MAVSPLPTSPLASRCLAVVVLLSLCLTLRSHAGGVAWNSTFFQTNLTSTGAPLDDTWVFELGAFLPGFAPTSANVAQWTTNWRAAQRSAYNLFTSGFGSSFDLLSNASPFGTNQLGYIWGHDCSREHGQWILVSAPTWKWPGVGGTDPPVQWSINSATNIILGQVNGPGFHMKMASVSSANLPTITPTEWKSLRFSALDLLDPSISGWNADPDHDGMSNLLEYAFGRDPQYLNRGWSLAPSWHPIGGNQYLKLSVPRCGYSLATLAVEVSGNLTTWSSSATEVETLSASTADVLQVRDRTAVSSASKRFLRLKASVP